MQTNKRLSKEGILDKFGTFENFMNCSSLRVVGHIDYNKIDSELHELIKILNDRKLYTINCCSGHGRRNPTIQFDTTVDRYDLSIFIGIPYVYNITSSTRNEMNGETYTTYSINFFISHLTELINLVTDLADKPCKVCGDSGLYTVFGDAHPCPYNCQTK